MIATDGKLKKDELLILLGKAIKPNKSNIILNSFEKSWELYLNKFIKEVRIIIKGFQK